MKFKVLLSILFFIATSLSALHELEHITQDDTACMVFHLNDKLTPIDILDTQKDVELFHFEIITHYNQILNLHVKNKSNPSHAPPIKS